MGEKKKSSFSLSKNLKISEAQQLLLLSVLAASVVLGVAISLSLNFINKISFNARVIGEKDKAIASYSDAFSAIGVCKKPKGETYSEAELRNCNPSSIAIEDIPGTLRYNIVNGLAANFDLNSVPKSGVDMSCVDPLTEKNYTIKELNSMYVDAETLEDRDKAKNLLQTCSALRTIPDALPAFENREAMLSSLNISGWQPEGLAPDSNEDSSEEEESGASGYGISITMEADLKTVQDVLQNIERSIREIDVANAAITYNDNMLKIDLQARAFFVNKTELSEGSVTVNPEKKGTKK